mgnify:CR=1 FL=1
MHKAKKEGSREGAFLFAFFIGSDDQNVADGRIRSVVVFRVFDMQRRALQREEGLGDVGRIHDVAARLRRKQRDHTAGAAVGAEHNGELRRHAEVDDAVFCAVADVAAGDELHRAVRHGLERGVDLLVVGVEVVHHEAVGLRPLVELVVGGIVACHKISSISYLPKSAL